MPVSWTIEPQSRHTLVTFTDPYTFQDWDSAFAEMVAARACEPWRRFLIDRRASTPPTTEFIRSMARVFSTRADLIGMARVAVVVSTEVGFGMGRMAQLLAEGSNPSITIRTFRDYAAAQQWLHVDRPEP